MDFLLMAFIFHYREENNAIIRFLNCGYKIYFSVHDKSGGSRSTLVFYLFFLFFFVLYPSLFCSAPRHLESHCMFPH